MDIKDLLEPQTVKALREMNEKMAALSKGITSSPVMEYMRQIEAQKKLFHDQFSGISQALRVNMPSHVRAIEEITRGLTPFVDQITKMHSPYQELMKQIQEQTRPFQEALKQFHDLQDRLNFSEISQACRVYARAAATIYGIDRMSEFKWRSLEQTLGVEAEIPTRGVEIPVTEETKAETPKPQTKKRVTVPQRKAVRASDPYL